MTTQPQTEQGIFIADVVLRPNDGGPSRIERDENEMCPPRRFVNESFVLFHREGAPPLFDTITRMCNKAGFSPRVECEPNMMQAVLTIVEAEQGISIVPGCVRNLRSDGVRFYRLQPDDVCVELVAAWKNEAPSVALRAFLDVIDEKLPFIRRKAELR